MGEGTSHLWLTSSGGSLDQSLGQTEQTAPSKTPGCRSGSEGYTYSADFQKCPGCESLRFSLGSFSSMSISSGKLGLSCRSKAQQADRISCKASQHWRT